MDKVDLDAKFREWSEREAPPRYQRLLASIKANLPRLKDLRFGGEDPVYRFYHHSFKVHLHAQKMVRDAVLLIREIKEQAALDYSDYEFREGYDKGLDPMFEKIVERGTAEAWNQSHNQNWLEKVAPIIEAYFHTQHMVKMLIRYGESLEKAPAMLPPGWATILYLFRIR